MGKTVYLSDEQLIIIEMRLIDVLESADLSEEDDAEYNRILDKLKK